MTPQTQAGGPRSTDTQSVPLKEWAQFLDQFTEYNHETAVRVEVVGSADFGTQILVEDRPLLAVSLDDAAGPTQVIIECGDTAGATPGGFRHIVQNPTAISARKTEPVGWDALQIETRGDGAVILTVNPHPGRKDPGLEEAGESEAG